MKLAVVVVLGALLSGQAVARTHVYVSHSGSDNVATSAVFHLREAIRASQGYSLAPSVEGAAIRIEIVSLDLASGNEARGVSSTMSIVFVLNNKCEYVAEHYVQTVGRDRARDVGERILANLDARLRR